MKTISITASKPYHVLVGSGLLQELGLYTKKITKAAKIAIVSDSNVWPLYGALATKSLEEAGFDSILSYVFPAGEESKNGETYLNLLNFLAEHQLTRSDCLIALGGGVVGDMTGFVAATYLRGIDYIQVPTTVLAAVDSSVGGKTAIDLPAGKNLAGAFCQPSLVLCDIDTLNTHKHIVDNNLKHHANSHIYNGHILLADSLKHIGKGHRHTCKNCRYAKHRQNGCCYSYCVGSARIEQLQNRA